MTGNREDLCSVNEPHTVSHCGSHFPKDTDITNTTATSYTVPYWNQMFCKHLLFVFLCVNVTYY